MKMFKARLLAALLLGAFSLSAAAQETPQQITIGYQKANIFALLKYRGTLEKTLGPQGIKVRWIEFPAGPQMLEGLNVGSIDLAATGDAPPAFAQAAKADLIYLAHSPASPKTEAILVPADSPIKTVADLKGKRVALNKGSDVNYLLVSALEQAGLSYKDVTPVYLPPSDARAAFQRGSVDAWVIWDPYYAEVETHANARLLKDAEGLVPHYTFFLASRHFAETYPDSAKQVIRQLSELSDWANAHQDQAAKILAESTGLDQAIWAKALARMPFGSQRMTPEVFNQQQRLADKFTAIGLLPVKVDINAARWSEDK
ncbi:Putative aliphatic sulfonates-binding protein precursor [Serratia entomophila]|jgi:sulfonate transport system substrate-binding protein|uniref:Sulfonate ABC transporter substrate-binding protein n=1 Tax=Serratia entomophila TaxID=42906 RepID=A0ABY5CNB5_9GAMM|nr:sulfonate ABC transporter substrate-binding protein [Serratia entomophila]UIW16258.1 sulfonate ABC transporter substrate-binding protein [Serratia entomophila]USU98816.1 sulfonate ABC transporter substrate-binding protein [Serratia entomophila]CAI0707888.1 Putative aliphatic sulfonates-binding protein precursor [Serratia entomophila]CAI0798773.1 Putative aliphatic sulfonates-binding protein precursor [Serratia entomophila]CAI0809065.1 Putative aliphatic sulfonates-binding protein precursor 